MPTPAHHVEHTLTRCEIERAPDPRLTVFEVTADRETDAVALSGTVLTAHLKARAVDAVERVTDAPVAASDVTVLESNARPRTVTTELAPVRSDPDADAEQVTQVLYGASLTAFDRDGAWRRVRTPDGYVAWLDHRHLAEPTEIDPDGVVSEERVEIGGDPETLFAGTECEVVERGPDETTVRFRTGAERSLPADAVAVPGSKAVTDSESNSAIGEAVTETARDYLGTGYVWGGMTVEGIDCSGLVWMAYRRHGVVLPRDADLQRRMGETVERGDLAPGDLLFFPGHVALSLGGESVVHAEGDADGVVIDSLAPDDDRYNQRLDEGFELAKRLV